jgi:ABC-2 type transport system ATP-binding protein
MNESPIEDIISVEGVSKSFGSFKALENITLKIPKGKIFGLLGPNGAGKTTLIRILTGITGPDKGSVMIGGNERKIGQIGYLPEERGLYRKMKVWDQALYLTQLKGLSETEAIANLKPWFERMDMVSWRKKPVESLSKGMQQRLQCVITVASNPEILILDEPFSGFDPINAEQLKQEILRLKSEGTTIALSTHNMSSVEELCSHVCLINKGEIILNDSLESIKSSFSKSIFEVSFIGSQVAFANSIGFQFEIVDMKEENGKTKALIKSHGKVDPNDLLSALIRNLTVKSFSEVLPSMNDIFIDLVNGEKEKVTA